MLPVAMDCPFLIAPSVFSNVYVLSFVEQKLLVKWSLPKGADIKKLTGFQIQYRQKGVLKGTLCTVVTTKKKQKYIITGNYQL
jgi:hypothetical protein